MPKDPAKAQKAKEKKERKALELQMKNSRDKVEEGRLLMEPTEPKAVPNYQKAIPCFDQAAEFYPENFEAFMYRGHAHRELGQLEAAIDDYSRAITLNIQCVAALEGRAACFESLSQWDSAIRDYTSVIELQPSNDHAFNMRGAARLKKRPPGLRLRNADYQAVVDDFLRATRLNENNYHAWCNLGRVYVEHKKFLEGIQAFTQAVALRDDYAYALYRRGSACIDYIEWIRKQNAVDAHRRVAHAAKAMANPFAIALGGGIPADDEDAQVAAVLPPKTGLLATSAAAAAAAALAANNSASGATKKATTSSTTGGGAAAANLGASARIAGGGAVAASSSPPPGGVSTNLSPEELAEALVQQEEMQAKNAQHQKEILTNAIHDFTKVIPLEDRLQVDAGAVLLRAICFFYRSEYATTEADNPPGVTVKGGDLEFARAELHQVHDFASKIKDDSQVNGSTTIGVLKDMSDVWLKRAVAVIAERKAAIKSAAAAAGLTMEGSVVASAASFRA